MESYSTYLYLKNKEIFPSTMHNRMSTYNKKLRVHGNICGAQTAKCTLQVKIAYTRVST